MSTVTLPLGLFLLVLAADAVVVGLLVATAADRLTRVRRETSHALYHQSGCTDRHGAGYDAVRPNPAALLHVHTDQTSRTEGR